MRIKLIASTGLETNFRGNTVIEELGMDLDDDATAAESLIEKAGRGCYKSEHKPNEKTRANKDYMGNILRPAVPHLSILEHAAVSFYVDGVSRSLTHELIRHRHFSFSQESQRFVTYKSDAEPVYHPTYDNDPVAQELLLQVWRQAIAHYGLLYDHFKDGRGLTRKQAAEAAREVLPNACPTSLVITGNLRAWYEFMPKRNAPSADVQIRKFAQEVLKHLKSVSPSIFNRFDEEV